MSNAIELEPPSKLKYAVRAAVYARYSSEMQSSSSAKDQINRICDLAQKGQVTSRLYPEAQIQIPPEWIHKDEAVTGKAVGRAGYQKILEGIRHKAFDLLIVDDLSRLNRSLGNLLELYQMLKHHDIELISVSDRLSSEDSNSRTFFTVKGMVADFGNEAHAERTKRGLEARARESFSTGQKPYGYGSRPTRMEKRKGREVPSHYELFIIPEQAEVVRRIFNLYAQGHGKIHIAKVLNKEGAPHSKAAQGWQTGPVHRILHNEKYIGRWAFNRNTYSFDPETGKRVKKKRPRMEWVVCDREHLRIIPQELWDTVAKRLGENEKVREQSLHQPSRGKFIERRRIDNLHLLSGVLSCPQCNHGFAIVSGKGKGYYGCINAHRNGTCNFRRLVPRERVEKSILNHLDKKIAANEDVIRYATEQYNTLVKKHLKQAPDRRKEVEAELKKLKTEIAKIIDFVATGSVTDSLSMSQALQERELRVSKLSEELSQLEHKDEQKLFVTPHFIRKKLMELIKTISEKGHRYNAIMREMFDRPLVLHEANGKLSLKGLLNLGNMISSRHCTTALPPGFEPGF